MVPAWPSNTDSPLPQLSSSPWDGFDTVVCDSTIPFHDLGRLLVGMRYYEIRACKLPPVPLYQANILVIPTFPKVTRTLDKTFVQQCGDTTREFASCYPWHPRLNQEPFSSSSFIRPSDMRECWLLRWWGSEQDQSMSVTSRGDGNWTHVFQESSSQIFRGPSLKENGHTPFETKSLSSSSHQTCPLRILLDLLCPLVLPHD